ncbi:hypothetical protein SERLA73DRAFT_178464 [Serpula lacrymans var. lacrymans S7.3]|uniref:Uncharacterized protein n=1 Tax=Serpula lacrymans var. lacrymans (strain S7.3) TaxID=936435 RepID=F8PRP4_SERL3|nr:hypothetical protein SERLA73DRAFT_178464 [Serpula lacrymans var. lacrymans S7.3]
MINISQVHTICKAAFTLLVFAYKALKQQIEQDDAIKALCVQLRNMLLAVLTCEDLVRIVLQKLRVLLLLEQHSLTIL